jgi:pyruvate/2-oxoacid:ferredoxin oxidoreductase beta subunit/Pyruvate/2-oxoacid:ferredoxin oxidoreductase gamma subunit
VTPLATYRRDTPYPFCPGCGHGSILDALNAALVELQRDPGQIVIVSDIGCSGLSDQYFATNAFHGLHGRSIAYASGIKLARPDLEVVVVMGDGGTGIGGAHLINAARRNIGMTVLVFNNFNFGMTGGQHSTTTPAGAATSTTPLGNLERPLDVCGTVAVNGAAYVYRGTSFDRDLGTRIAEAIASPGFALLDIWELCTAYYVPRNKSSKRALFGMLDELDLAAGVIARREVEGYEAAYRKAHAELRGRPVLAAEPIERRFAASLARPMRLVVAGAAGGKVRSAARLAGRAALLSGLWAAQREDYPVTVQTGHSISELIFSPEPFAYTGIEKPDATILLAAEGLGKASRYLSAMGPDDTVYAEASLPAVETTARVVSLDLASAGSVGRTGRSLALLTVALLDLEALSEESLMAAADIGPARHRDENRAAIAAGKALVQPSAGE